MLGHSLFKTYKLKMKKYSFLLISLAALFCMVLSSCHNKDKVNTVEYSDPRADSTMQRSSTDTLALLTMCTDYLNLLKKDSVEAALDLLYVYDDGKVEPISDEVRDKIRATRQRFPVVNYQLESMRLFGEDDTEFIYMVEFFEKPKDDPRPNTIREALSPVRVDGQWYLTVSDEISEDR